MDWNGVEGNWKQVEGKVREQWGKLTDDDLDVIDGRREQLEGKTRTGTAIRRVRSAGRWTTGTIAKPGERLTPEDTNAAGGSPERPRLIPGGAINQLIYLIGLIVVILAILSFFGLR